ncbi:MAG TPA: MOSC N-terminal beta barrel domain-containing protein, partial [Pyrinomonadaceae bacterium]
MIIGTVTQIWRHPVKSMAGETLEACSLGPLGIPGDRGWALRDETTGEITNGKRIPALMQCSAKYMEGPSEDYIPPVEITFPDGSKLRSDDGDVNARLSEFFEREVTLWPRE